MTTNTQFTKEFYDTLHSRQGTGAIKYMDSGSTYMKGSVIPMWVADMDFQSPPAVNEALSNLCRHGIYGYTETGSNFNELVAAWYDKRYGVTVEAKAILQAPSVMFGIASTIKALTKTGDAILIMQPVYYPFANVIPANDRVTVVSELCFDGTRYEMDYTDIEEKIINNNVKAILLCSPHNPVGRVWTKAELSQLADICLKHNVYIISDEIHGDFIYAGHTHTPIISLSEKVAEITVICTSPTKTFNIAGLQASNIITTNDTLRRRIAKECSATGYSGLNAMAIAATKAAYSTGEPWLNGLLDYLQSNVKALRSFTDQTDGRIKLIEPEGTYLMWLDCREMDLSDEDLNDFFLNKCGIWLHKGTVFGKGGNGFMRMNIACPMSVLTEALDRVGLELI